MNFKKNFSDKRQELDSLLQQLNELERLVTSGASVSTTLKSLSIIRASFFLVAYNIIEAATREAIAALIKDVASHQRHYSAYTDAWRIDFLKSTYLDALQSGVNFENLLQKIDGYFSNNKCTLSFAEKKRELPFPGNVNAEKIRSYAKRLSMPLTIPQTLQGGIDLDKIWENRNNLSHGNKTFDEVGANYTLLDLDRMFKNAEAFLNIFFRELQKYKKDGKYLRHPHRSTRKRDLKPTATNLPKTKRRIRKAATKTRRIS